MPVDPITSRLGPEFSIPGIERPGATTRTESDGPGFGELLTEKLGELAKLQHEASVQAQKLATGQAESLGDVVIAVEHAALSLQLASAIRTKGVEAYQEIMRMQI
jgi:flagellar hook-basal body complex protein FliE